MSRSHLMMILCALIAGLATALGAALGEDLWHWVLRVLGS